MDPIRTDKNHILLLYVANPKTPPETIVKNFSSITAKEIFWGKPQLRNKLKGLYVWLAGQYAGTVGEWAIFDRVGKWVKSQGIPKPVLRQPTLF